MAESYDLSQHELLVSPAAGSTRLKISDKAGSISLTLDVKKEDKAAIACMKQLLGPLIALLTKEMDESPNQAGWDAVCESVSAPSLKALYSDGGGGARPPPSPGDDDDDDDNDDDDDDDDEGGGGDTSLAARFKAIAESGDINKPIKDQITPLLLAAQLGDGEAARVALKAGARPNDKTADGLTPLHHAVQQGSIDCMRAFLEGGADPNAAAPDGTTPALVAAESNLPDVLELLLLYGARADAQDAEGCSGMIFACQAGYVSVLEVLLAAGADTNVKTADGWCPLLIAAQENAHQCVSLLIRCGADVDSKTNDKESAVLLCAQYGAAESLKLLLAAHADPNYKAGTITPLQIAEAEGQTAVAALLAAGHTPDAAERKEVKQHAQVAVAAQKEKRQAHQLKVSEAKGGKPPTLTAKRGKPGGGLKGAGSSKKILDVLKKAAGE